MRHIIMSIRWCALCICIGCSDEPQQISTDAVTETESIQAEHSIAPTESAESLDTEPFVEADQSLQPALLVRSLLVKSEEKINAEEIFSHVPLLENHVKYSPMRPNTIKILRDAVVAATTDDSDLQKSNLEVLDRLAKMSWPSILDLKRVRVELNLPDRSDSTNWLILEKESTGWLILDDEKAIHWLEDNFRMRTAHKSVDEDGANEIKRVEYTDFKAEINAFIHLLPEREKSDHIWEWDHKHGIEWWHGGIRLLLLNLAYTTAEHGLQQETNSLVALLFNQCPGGLLDLQDDFVWAGLEQAIDDLNLNLRPVSFSARVVSNEKDWQRFLRTCKELRHSYPNSKYQVRIKSLIDAIEVELSKPPPEFLTKPKEQFTQEETIQYLIYQLRDLAAVQHGMPGSPDVFGGQSPADFLVAIGSPAIPYLIEAMDDAMPTRTPVFSRHTHDSKSLLRRQDIVSDCLKRITGCRFYYCNRVRTLAYDTSDRQKSAIQHAKAWWDISKNRSQAKMLRNYLSTIENNKSLNDKEWADIYNHCRIDALTTLAHLEGPEGVLEELRKIPQERFFDGPTSLELFVPSSPAKRAFKELERNTLRYDDMVELLKYGDRETYHRLADLAIKNELVEDPDESGQYRFVASIPKKRPGAWFHSEHVEWAAKYGQNWAIPLFFSMLRNTNNHVSSGEGSFSTADLAMDEIIKMTQIDFGYDPRAQKKDRLKVFQKARDWWQKEGRTQLAPMIAKDHPPLAKRGDLLFTRQRIATLTAAISGGDDIVRRRTVAQLGTVYSYQIQRALLNALAIEQQAGERLRILSVLKTRPMLWHLPALTTVFVDDNDIQCRIEAGRIIAGLLKDRPHGGWWIRLETRDTALSAARQIVQAKDVPVELRQVASEILLRGGSFLDELDKKMGQD